MAIERQRSRRPRIEIIPMIDVVFFLLVFFMMFTSFRETPAGLNVNLPRGSTAVPQPAGQFEVAVDRTGALYAGGRRITALELQRQVAAALRQRPDLFIIIRGDKEARYEHVVAAMDAVRAVGGYRLGLAVEMEPTGAAAAPQPSRGQTVAVPAQPRPTSSRPAQLVSWAR